ncbi:hypothetical protein MAR_022826 [Mya arenaria]|uniref:Uncharacterized protein n=1 Tax=Mya arenaria TaxID=6604 RepID=A0ABY7DNK0_MYAAR|nr:hypothetical protein MAR_022826 [Mya arenaria]
MNHVFTPHGLFVKDLATTYNVDPIITFDQPLWYKTQLIIAPQPQSSPMSQIVCRLSALHIQMSFLGTIGKVMNDSGVVRDCSLLEMLPFFAATGHNAYAKSTYIYLNRDLSTTYPQVYKNFMEGIYGVQHSDRNWAGLSTDVIIE